MKEKVEPKKLTVMPPAFDEALAKEIAAKWGTRLHDALDTAKYPKLESYGLIDAIKKEIKASIPEDDEDKLKLAMRAFERLRETYLPRRYLESQAASRCSAVRQDSADYLRGEFAAARARVGAVHARRDAGSGDRDARAPRKTSSGSICSSKRNRSSASCCTTTSRRFRSAK